MMSKLYRPTDLTEQVIDLFRLERGLTLLGVKNAAKLLDDAYEAERAERQQREDRGWE